MGRIWRLFLIHRICGHYYSLAAVKDTSNILRYWRAVELFSPQSVPKVQPEDDEKPAHHFDSAKGPAPWETQPRLEGQPSGEFVWRHEVYAGVYRVRLLRELLEEKFGEDPESYDERLDTESALFCLSVSHDGRPLFGTTVLSTCAWAWGRTIAPGPAAADWLEGYDEFSKKFIRKVREQLALEDGDDVGAKLLTEGADIGRPIVLADVVALSAWLLSELGVDAPRISDANRVSSRPVKERYAYESDGTDFLNSFFVEGLGRVADEVQGDNAGRALLAYLAADNAIDESKRVDIRRDLGLPSERPNLLNVAVSRAKRRLYIIGNRNTWEGYDNFDRCSEILGPHNTWERPIESYLR